MKLYITFSALAQVALSVKATEPSDNEIELCAQLLHRTKSQRPPNRKAIAR